MTLIAVMIGITAELFTTHTIIAMTAVIGGMMTAAIGVNIM